jgi:RNA polymerase sigma-70 factor (sigma-E family)
MDFDEFAAGTWDRLVRAAVLLGADRHAAEDLAQVTLAQCYASWSRVSRADDVHAYVHRMLINAHASSRRRRWWGERPAADPPDRPVAGPEDAVLEHEGLRAALDRLPLGQRQVLVLRYFVDLTEAQTADVLHLSRGTVKSRASRALAALSTDPALALDTDSDTDHEGLRR